MLALIFALIMPANPTHVSVWHGNRHEIVFTEGATIAARPACETLPPRVDGYRVKVCAGHVVSFTDASGYTLDYPEVR